MKLIYSIACMLLAMVGCQPPQGNSVNEAFEKNSQTVMTYLEGIQTESLDYDALYAKDAIVRGTGFGSPDSLTLSDIIAENNVSWSLFDLELVTDPIVLLPGVNVDTKMADGSVRYYGDWKITIPATDSTNAKSGVLRLYESFDFDENGKIVFQQYYGDYTALIIHLMTNKSDSTEEGESE
ncbi:MAG: hypothetical protein ABJF04_00215 [Reichenbachiella sp.]|uniref:hypothetical protein n=1 Tax=Reichenbachiella sp. TaxID=2184521 RepID=UPI003266F6A6